MSGRNFSSWQGLRFGFRLRPPFNLYFWLQLKSFCFYVATSEWCHDLKWSLSLKTSCHFVYLQTPLLWLSLMDPRRDIGVMSRPQLYSVGVATSEWCRDMKILLLDTSFSLDHISCKTPTLLNVIIVVIELI